MNLFSIAKAAESNIVSCTGNNCDVCSLLETISNTYNFFLAVSFAVAVLVLVIAGVNYLLNSSDRSKTQKSLYFLKSGVIGFTLIILGWIVIQGSLRMIGYQNAGEWWHFQCNIGNNQTALNENKTNDSLFSPFYNNLKTFPDLASYFKSGEDKAKLTGPADVLSFSNQLNNLKDGEILHFLAPVRLDSTDGAENLFLPLLTVAKEGDNLKLNSTGEYWDLIQNLWPEVKNNTSSLSESDLGILNSLLGESGFTSDGSLLNAKDGSTINASSNNTGLSSLYGSIAKVLSSLAPNGDRSMELPSEKNLSGSSLSDLIAFAESYNQQGENQSATNQLISLLTTGTLKLVSTVMVDKENIGDILSTANSRCQSSGGEWVGNQCQCPSQNILGQDGTCRAISNLKDNCEKSKGEWKKAESGDTPTQACDSSSDALFFLSSNKTDTGQTANEEFCKCKDSSCLSDSGLCLDLNRDDDGDKIANNLDRCPNTPSAEKNEVNKKEGSKFYGCSCSEIGMVKKECPPDQCVGDNWVTYPSGKQECKNGMLLSYSCNSLQRNFNKKCVDLNKLAKGNNNSNSNLNNNNSNFDNRNSNNNFVVSNSSNNNNINSNSSQNNTSLGGGTGGKKPNSDDFAKKPSGGDKVPSGEGNDGSNTPQGQGTIEDLKKALRRIYERDKLRYEMIFRNIKTISRTSFPGGLCYGCGYIEVNASMPLGIMDQIIVHESTHSGHACVAGWGNFSAGEIERIACANQMGSIARDNSQQNPDMKEFPRQLTAIDYEGEEVRGYTSRRLTRVNPNGDLGTATYNWPISYALSYGDSTMGPFRYGDPKSSMVLGLKDKEENVIKRVMEDQRKCISKPTKDLPPVEACENASEIQFK